MARFNDLGEGKIEGRKLDPRAIVVRDGFNFRDITTPQALAHIAWLKENIRDRGVQEPIRVEYSGGVAYLVNGQCRVEACKQLWDEGVKVPYKEGGEGPPLCPAIVVTGDEAEILAASITANGGLPPSKMEFGAAAKRLLAFGWSAERVAKYTPPHIAQKAAQANRYVREAVELHEAPLAVKQAVAAGVDGVQVSEALALQAVRDNRETAPAVVAQAAADAKAKGETVARRPKAATLKTDCPDLLELVQAVLEDIPLTDLVDDELPYLEIDRKLLLALHHYVKDIA